MQLIENLDHRITQLGERMSPASPPPPTPQPSSSRDPPPFSLFFRILGKLDVIEAAQSGDIELVKDHVMADAGCVLQADSRYGCLFLELALPQPMQFGSIFLISVISGFTALMESSRYGHFDITRFLVESGGNLDAKDIKYYTLQYEFSNRAHRCSSVQFF